MKYDKTIIKKVVYLVMIMAVITISWSCTGNENASTVDSRTTNDSSNNSENSMSTATNNDVQPSMMNDSNATTNNGTNNIGNTGTDASFMMQAAAINLEEIKLGKLAQQKGTASHVKALGKMMVTAHTEAMKGLTTMAKSKMVNLPATEDEKIMTAYTTLNEKSGKEFDKAYSDLMVNGHKDAIALFEKTNNETKDAEVKAMTTSMIPKLKTHLEHSVKCQKECEKM